MKWFLIYLLCILCFLQSTGSYADPPADDFLDVRELENQPSSLKRDTLLIKKYYAIAYDNLYKSALLSTQYGQKALRLAQSRQWDTGKLLAYNVLCHYYYINADFDVLMELATSSLRLAIKEANPLYEAESNRFIAHGYSQYAKIDSATSYYQRALHLIEQQKNDSLLAAYHENLASHFRDHDIIHKAIAEYSLADSLYKIAGSRFGVALVALNKGFLYIRTKQFQKAAYFFSRALFQFDRIDSDYGRMSAYNDLANAYYLQKKYDLAISNALKADSLANSYKSPKQINWALTTLYRSYRDMGQLEEALHYMEELNYNRRADNGSFMERRFNLFQLLHENEKMDVAIRDIKLAQQRNLQEFLIIFSLLVLGTAVLLYRKNKELRRKNEEIKEAMVQGQTLERKRVAAELHDTLGGTIAAINWYMSGINKKSLPIAEQKIYDRLQDMVSGAYQEVRSLSHNYFPKVLEEEGLVQAMERLVEKLNQNNQVEFTLTIKGMTTRPIRQIEFELYSTVLELANNILKHARASQAYLSLTGTEKSYTLTVADNGIGFGDSPKEGVGLNNVRNRVESLGGKLVKTHEKDQGTFVRITIPRSQESYPRGAVVESFRGTDLDDLSSPLSAT